MLSTFSLLFMYAIYTHLTFDPKKGVRDEEKDDKFRHLNGVSEVLQRK
jgi:hypothetical protein